MQYCVEAPAAGCGNRCKAHAAMSNERQAAEPMVTGDEEVQAGNADDVPYEATAPQTRSTAAAEVAASVAPVDAESHGEGFAPGQAMLAATPADADDGEPDELSDQARLH